VPPWPVWLPATSTRPDTASADESRDLDLETRRLSEAGQYRTMALQQFAYVALVALGALLASKGFGTLALFSATTSEPTTYTLRSDGCVQIASFTPEPKLTKPPELLDDRTVSRLSVLPEDV
jgi:hypothetical protein